MRAAVLPSANRIGDELGRIVGRQMQPHIVTAMRTAITQGGTTARTAATRQGDQAGGAFGRTFRNRVQAAMQNLPRGDVRLSTTGADADLARLRARLETLGNRRVGVDVDAATALAEIERLERDLERVGARHPDINVRIDSGQARAELAALRAEIARLDGQDIDVDVDTHRGVAGFNALVTAAVAFGPAILPVLPVVAAGLGAVAAAGVAAGAGLGAVALVAAPALKQIGTVLQAQKAAQDAATQSTTSGGQAAAQAATRSLQLASAQQSLASAERNGAKQIAQAQQAVGQARRNAAQVAAQASLRAQQAARAVEDAEEALADAQRDARRAQEDLTAARRTAAQELEDLNSRLSNARLSQRDAEIALKEAAAERDKVLKSATSTELDKQKALLQYDQAVQRLKDQTTETKRLDAETKAANKAGVEGSETVRGAQERLAAAQGQVADRARSLRDAQAEQARTAQQNAQDMADAQQRIADAQANVADVQRQAAESVASAQRQLQQAQMSTAGGADAAAAAQAKYRAELAKLTPSARDTLGAFVDLRSAFGEWSKSLQPKVMPIFTRALNGMRRALPGLTPFVTEAADAIGELQDRASRGFKSPWWKSFKKDLQGSVRPAIVGLGVAFGNIFKGMGGVIGAFLPHMDDISGSMQRITKRFADWGTSLKGSPVFEKFLDYAKTNGPIVGDTLGEIASAFLSVSKALSPVSGPLLKVLGIVADFVGTVADKAPVLVIALWGVILAWKAWTAVMWLWAAALAASGWTLLVIGLFALAAAVVYCWNKFPGFRAAVMAAWEGIKKASLYLWNTILKPFFVWFGGIVVWLWQKIIKPYVGFLIAYWKTVARVAVWLWKNVLAPTFEGIGAIISWWWTNIVKRYFGMVKFAFQTIAAVAMWLWNKAIKPAFNGIAAVVMFWWNNVVKKYFGLVRGAINTLGSVFRWLYEKTVKPVWASIKSAISTAWERGIRPAFGALRTAVGKVADAFETAKEAIRKAWDKVKEATKKPINFVLGTVWNEGIVSAWKKIGDWIPGLPKLKKLPLLAAGGALPVQPGMFNQPTAIVGEGNPRFPEFVIPTDPKYRSRALGLWQAAGGQLMEDGGILGDITGGLKNLGGKIGGALGSAAGFLKDPGKVLDAVMAKLLKPLQAIRNSGWGKLALGLPKGLLKGLKDLVTGGGPAEASVGAVGGSGVKRWTGVVQQALRLVGQPLSYTGITLRRMNQESGGNPTIVNKWDSNWQAGHPSVGLMQVIGPTFRSYAGRYRKTGPFSYGVSTNPLANVYASMRYALAAYGSLPRAYNRAGGYDSGGYLQPGLNLAYNGTGRPEPVFTTNQANALTSLASRGVEAGGVGDLHVKVYVGDREITDIARAEVHRSNGELITALGARPTGR
jgi:phage-related protein